MREVEISPSILSANFARLSDDLQPIRDKVDSLHIDVMDGHFVPNITIGPVVSNSLKKELENLPFHIHLMISNPLEYASRFEAGSEDTIIFHVEVPERPASLVEKIRELGPRVGVSLNPDTDPEPVVKLLPEIDEVLVMSVQPGFGGQEFREDVLEKIGYLREKIDENSHPVSISVDGGVNPATGKKAVKAGADVLVSGSAIFSGQDKEEAVDRLRSKTEEGRRGQ